MNSDATASSVSDTLWSKEEKDELAAFEELVKIGFVQACRVGIPCLEREDCAHDFAVHLFHKALSDGLMSNKPYLHRSAHNFACNYLRALKPCTCLDEIPERDLQMNFKPEFLRAELRCLFQQILPLLTPLQQDVLQRYYYGEESLLQIASSLRITVSGAKMHLHRARVKLRLIIEEDVAKPTLSHQKPRRLLRKRQATKEQSEPRDDSDPYPSNPEELP
ncbi:RNA polymerase sigma factor [Chthonomonas calidirosea]|uniref:RNA polymerase sigma factor n=1 Tax=Chthonomonas calidirosea TaxID=454171 RepID=UPI0006EC82F8|nr:sigma-70 family RNA polymerase sigma factor [Chthonomonas calidirosea]CEK15099.1 DNA-directed RNA polymerase specialized sigma subunit, sigma24 [Chthonomonas calidirosea]